MEIISDKDTTDITYYLTNEHEYMGSSFTTGKNQEFITVMDLPNAAIHTFMDFGDQKTTNSFKIPLEDSTDDALDTDGFSIVSTGQTKTILDYECEEFEVTGPRTIRSSMGDSRCRYFISESIFKFKIKENEANERCRPVVG